MFWLLAFGLAWAITVPAALSAHGIIDLDMPQGLTRLTGFAPAIAAVITALAKGEWRAFAARVARIRTNPIYYLLALALPPALLLLSVEASPRLGLPAPSVQWSDQFVVLGAVWLVLAFGEEAGWRGYALPNLIDRHGFWQGATILGFAWTIWHYPLMLAGPYLTTLEDTAYWLGLFSLQIFIANFLICWLMARSGAVVVATLFHTAFNVVSTVHYAASIDLVITAAFAALVFIVAAFDAEPRMRQAE